MINPYADLISLNICPRRKVYKFSDSILDPEKYTLKILYIKCRKLSQKSVGRGRFAITARVSFDTDTHRTLVGCPGMAYNPSA